MIKDLLVPLTETAGDVFAVNAAACMAAVRGAHLTVLKFVNLPIPVAGPWDGGDLAFGELYKTFRDGAQKDAQAWRERLTQQFPGLCVEVRLLESFAAEGPAQAALQARHADLSVLPMAIDAARDGAAIKACFTGLLLASGRPTMLVPAVPEWREPQHVMVAWQPRREATRALHDAMPFLHAATRVELVAACADRSEEGVSADILAHLQRHALDVRAETLPTAGRSVAATLLAHAQQSQADMLVLGGYGHSRFREWAMGGVTAELLASPCPVPLLFSH
ncbi:MAG: universal stress protein [Proteobacteria bacterium]|nr:universal stress protein [Pseudomonadota bacterium]